MTQIIYDINLAVESLKKGEVVALPSETVYGLGASIASEGALEEIYALKKRPQDNPLIVHASSYEMVESIAYVNDDFKVLYDAFMPGPLTVLLLKKEVSDKVTRGLNTVGIRIPRHPLFRAVIEALGTPIAAPSANLSGKPSSTHASHVVDDFSPHLKYVLDGGSSSCGIESTIIQVFDDHGVILRPGAITKAQLENALSRPFVFAKKDAALQAPGMKYRHYAPIAKVLLCDDITQIPQNDSSVLVMGEELVEAIHFRYLKEETLYAAFREADELGLKSIYVLVNQNLSEGIRNRLEKAAH